MPTLNGSSKSAHNLSIKAYHDFVNLLKGWYKEKEGEVKSLPNNYDSKNSVKLDFTFQKVENWKIDLLYDKINQMNNTVNNGYIDKEIILLNEIANLFISTPPEFLAEVLIYYVKLINKGNIPEGFEAKSQEISKLINDSISRETILFQMSKSAPHVIAENLMAVSIEDMKELVKRMP